ncbi:glia maturation factor gamma isoform X1 [Chelonia mydas]|uniref:glia maturation factor gamma isoform X1 n=3 Tax=Durocryptodira TaxID=1579337 RepID=UPI001CA8DA7B|nr:glia maturation factor gamma isoform X1 [Chelonia mydas]
MAKPALPSPTPTLPPLPPADQCCQSVLDRRNCSLSILSQGQRQPNLQRGKPRVRPPGAERAEIVAEWSGRALLHAEGSDSLVVCDVDPALKEKLRKFRFRKETNNAAILMKIDKERQLVVLEEEFQDISPEELKSELPERQPRFVVYSYKYVHDDGRISYPLCFIFSSPVGCKPEQQMMYAGSKNRLVQAAELTKVFEIRTTEDLTEEWLRERLAFFR